MTEPSLEQLNSHSRRERVADVLIKIGVTLQSGFLNLVDNRGVQTHQPTIDNVNPDTNMPSRA